MSTAQTSGRNSNETNRPVVTWSLMVLALIVVALIPDWTESGANRPLWLFVVPIVLGLGGAVFAVRNRHFWSAALDSRHRCTRGDRKRSLDKLPKRAPDRQGFTCSRSPKRISGPRSSTLP